MMNSLSSTNTQKGKLQKPSRWGSLHLALPILLVLLLLSMHVSIAQETVVVTGRITSSTDGDPIPGATVVVKGTTQGAVTDLEGNYSISTSVGSILIYNFLGYLPQERAVTSEVRTIDLELQEDVAQLEEVVVVGYGQMRRSDLSSAQVSVTSEDIVRSRSTSLDQALQGRAAGVFVTQNSGQPGSGASVYIRGVSSIHGSTSPMYVIDGVQIMGSEGSENALAGINPDDIESMEVLLGPTATAIYGSRAANGVIVITTKRGQAGETQINYSGTYSVQDLPNMIPTMNLREYAEFMNEYNRINNWGMQDEFADPSLLGEGTNWQRELFQIAPMQKHQISLSGGMERTNFYFSSEYFSQDGVAIGSGFDRYSFRLNLDNQTREWLKVGTNFMASTTSETLTITEDNIINTAIQQAPNIAVRNPDGSWGGPSQTQFRLSNPVALAEINQHDLNRYNGMGGLFTEITPIEGLLIRVSLNANAQFTNRSQFEPSYQFDGFVKDENMSSRGTGQTTGWNFLQLVQYSRNFDRHHLGLMASHEAQESVWEGLNGQRRGFITSQISELPAGDPETATNSSYKGSWAMESYFGRLNYMFDDRYILQATLRADGSPNFGINNRWGYFPAASVAWRIDKESFLTNVEQINNLKLRLEYGITGNQNSGGPAHYANMRGYATPWGTGFLVENFSNPNFLWEETETYNVGLDVNLFRNRVELIVDAYLKRTDNLMLRIPLPSYMGTTGEGSIQPPWENIGGIENRGIGVNLTTVNFERPVMWRSTFTISFDRNELTKLYTESSIIDRTPWFMDGFIARSVIGEPVWQFYGYQSDGLFQTLEEVENHPTQTSTGRIDENTGSWVGDVRYINQNDDDVIDERDRAFIGNPWPKFTFGINNTISYNNWDLYIFLQGVYGNQIFNYTRWRNEDPNNANTGRNFYRSLADFAQIDHNENGDPYLLNPDTSIPRIIATNPNDNQRVSDMWVEDGSYLRIQNVQLSYTIPRQRLNNLPMETIRLTAGVQNLYTFTNYTGYDPEIGQRDDVIGIDYGRYPSVRVYTLSASIDF